MKLNWEYKGIAAVGDAHGEIYLDVVVVNQRTITRRSHGNGRRVYEVGGQSFRRLRDAVTAAEETR